MVEDKYFEKMERKHLIREINILRQIIIDFIHPAELLKRYMELEHARTRYFNVPKSWVDEVNKEINEDEDNG